MNQAQAARYLGVPQGTIGNWLGGTRQPNKAVSRLLDVLSTIEVAAPAIHDTLLPIREPLATSGADQGEQQDGDGPSPDESLDSTATDSGEDLADAPVPRHIEALTAQNDLGERYAKAMYQIGKLEADNANLRAQIERGNQDLAEAKQRITVLEASTPARPWWKL
jgi:hypothetical protein